MLNFDAKNAEGVPHIDAVPKHTMAGLLRWTLFGIPTGGFLRSVLIDDRLSVVLNLADDENRKALFAIYCFISNQLPSGVRDIMMWQNEDFRKTVLGNIQWDLVQNAELVLSNLEKSPS